eukprot:TRINITY_DN11405_c0_g1_i1.p1 TRINITY_DN11405_c0_g1~~TRINITY_DN11405_c0_g1_i1.p1  ORF type:complete len:114 (-),score=26.55 TRINITY_DN11405_c0_g1_i1:229-570(-)
MPLPLSLQGVKSHHSMGEIGRGGDALKLGMLERLIAGPGSTLQQMSEQQVDRMIKYNSVCREHAEEIRAAYADSSTRTNPHPEYGRKLAFQSQSEKSEEGSSRRSSKSSTSSK